MPSPPFTVPELEELRAALDASGCTVAEVITVLRTTPKTLKVLARQPR